MKVRDISIDRAIKHLIDICRRELELEKTPKVSLIHDQESIGGGSFGTFDPTSGEIQVVVRGRHTMDVMRTLAHEMVHWKQSQMGLALDGSTGSECEDQANSLAGSIMRRLAKSHPELFI